VIYQITWSVLMILSDIEKLFQILWTFLREFLTFPSPFLRNGNLWSPVLRASS